MKKLICNFILNFILLCSVSYASKIANGPYIQSIQQGGTIYARAIPQEVKGELGTTKIYGVKIEGDKLIDSYDWYNYHGVLLASSPIAGKVAVFELDLKKEWKCHFIWVASI